MLHLVATAMLPLADGERQRGVFTVSRGRFSFIQKTGSEMEHTQVIKTQRHVFIKAVFLRTELKIATPHPNARKGSRNRFSPPTLFISKRGIHTKVARVGERALTNPSPPTTRRNVLTRSSSPFLMPGCCPLPESTAQLPLACPAGGAGQTAACPPLGDSGSSVLRSPGPYLEAP